MADMKQKGFDIELYEGDVCSFDSMGDMIQKIETDLGPIDILVNNAGITKDGRFAKMTLDDWNAVINTNLNSVFNVTRHVINGMIERNFGRIINISSVNGQRGQFGQTNYSAAKAGMHGFTKHSPWKWPNMVLRSIRFHRDILERIWLWLFLKKFESKL